MMELQALFLLCLLFSSFTRHNISIISSVQAAESDEGANSLPGSQDEGHLGGEDTPQDLYSVSSVHDLEGEGEDEHQDDEGGDEHHESDGGDEAGDEEGEGDNENVLPENIPQDFFYTNSRGVRVVNGEAARSRPADFVQLIYAGEVASMPAHVIEQLDDQEVYQLLLSEVGARLAASRVEEVFHENSMIYFLDFDDIHPNFFATLNFESLPLHALPNLSSAFLKKVFDAQIPTGTFNLNGFYHKLKHFSVDICLELPPLLLLPHLGDLQAVDAYIPSLVFSKGYNWDEDRLCSNPRELLIWMLSIQFVFFKTLLAGHVVDSDMIVGVLDALRSAFSSQRVIGEVEGRILKTNFLGAQYSNPENCPGFFSVLGEPTSDPITFEEAVNILGFADLTTTKYSDLSTTERIVYRMALMLACFADKTSLSTHMIKKYFLTMNQSAEAKDFSSREVNLIMNVFLCTERFGLLGFHLSSVPNSLISQKIRQTLANEQEYHKLIKKITQAIDRAVLLMRPEQLPNRGIALEDESYFKTRELARFYGKNGWSFDSTVAAVEDADGMVEDGDNDAAVDDDLGGDILHQDEAIQIVGAKRCSDGSVYVKKHRLVQNFNEHFIDEELKTKIPPRPAVILNDVAETKRFVIPFPEKKYVDSRMDCFWQHLESPDLGEAAWAEIVLAIEDEAMLSAAQDNEKKLKAFVAEAIKVVHYMLQNPGKPIEVDFNDNSGFGVGLLGEMMDTLARVVLLSPFKLFYYSRDLVGFVTYPLLHESFMEVLGFIRGWSLEKMAPVDWRLAVEFSEFLNYEENFENCFNSLSQTLYQAIFRNFESYLEPGMNPLDYYPTTFYAHCPFALVDGDHPDMLDLLSPDLTSSPYASMEMFLDEADKTTLEYIFSADEMEQIKAIFAQEAGQAEETKDEDAFIVMIEVSEQQQDLISLYRRQMFLKQSIVQSMTKETLGRIRESLLLGRFCHMRSFLFFIRPTALPYFNNELFAQIQAELLRPITVEELESGMVLLSPDNILVSDNESQTIISSMAALMKVLRKFDEKTLRTFYWFITGSFHLPIGGLINYPIKVNIQAGQGLPTAQTCYRQLNYKVGATVDAIMGAFLTALRDCDGYHFIENYTQRAVVEEQVPAFTAVMEQIASNTPPSLGSIRPGTPPAPQHQQMQLQTVHAAVDANLSGSSDMELGLD